MVTFSPGDVQVQPQVGTDLVNAGALARFATEAVHDGVFQLECRKMAVGKTVRMYRGVNDKRAIRGNHVLPRETGPLPVEVVGGFGLKRRQVPQHAHGKSAVHANRVKHFRVALKGDAPSSHLNVGRAGSLQFFGGQIFQACQGFQIEVHPPLRLVWYPREFKWATTLSR